MRRATLLAVVLLATLVVAAPPAGAHPPTSDHPPRAHVVEWDVAAPVDELLGATVGAVVLAAAPARVLAVPGPALVAATPLPEMPWAVLAALAGGSLLLARRRRAGLALALVLVLGILAFETGFHSTHHLERPDEAARCVVAGASAQLSADLVDVTLDVPRASVVPDRVAVPDLPAAVVRVVPPDAGRAPPVPSA
jgi:hypothetical protein